MHSMEFSSPEYWNGSPLPYPGDLSYPGIEPRSLTLQADSLPGEPQGKPKNTGVGSVSLLQGIFPTQESNQGQLYCRQILFTNWAIREALKDHQFYFSFQKNSSFKLIFSIVFLVSMWFISALIFVISFLLLNLVFVLSPVPSGARLGYIFEIFAVSWGRVVLP